MRIWYQGMGGQDEWPHYYSLMQQYLSSIADPGTTVDVHGRRGVGGGVHRSVHLLHSLDVIANALKAEREGYDAFVIGNTFDAAMEEIRELVDIPVVGAFQTALLLASTMGRNFAVIVPDEKSVARWEEMVTRYGWRDRLTAVENIDCGYRELDRALHDSEYASRFTSEFLNGVRGVVARGAEIVIPAGALVGLFLGRAGLFEAEGAMLLNPMIVSLKWGEMAAKLRSITGACISRKANYRKPPEYLLQEIAAKLGLH